MDQPGPTKVGPGALITRLGIDSGLLFIRTPSPPMNPDRLLRNMCIRHGISPGEVRSLVPVIRKALEAPAWVRDRILSIVEGNLAERSEEQADEEALAQDLDRELLFAVAAMLHGWEPKNEMRDLYGNADEPPAA
jgi:hypothetical protein